MTPPGRLRMLASTFGGLFGRGRHDADLASDIEAHLEALTNEHVQKGLAIAEARAAARRDFGGVEHMKDLYRDERGWHLFDSLARDIRYALRALRRSPGFLTAAVLSLGLGIGANSAVFGVVNAAFMRELPVRDPDSLTTAYWRGAGGRGNPRNEFSYPIFRELETRQQVFSEMAASGAWRFNRVQVESDSEEEGVADIQAGIVSANYFSMLGVRAALGRVFVPEDSRSPGEGAVVVLSDGFWARRFGRDPSVLGRTMLLNNIPFSIIGVAPGGFLGDPLGVTRDFWVPLLMQPRLSPSNQLERRTASWFRTIGRLKSGVTETAAKAELTGLFRQSLTEENASGTGTLIGRRNPAEVEVVVERGSQAFNVLRQRIEQPLTILMAVVGLVLLIACCNVANLLLARNAARQREMAIRLGIGASRFDLMRQLMTESLLLAAAGGAAGLLFARATRDALVRTLMIGAIDLDVDRTVLGFTALVSLTTTVLIGLIPAIQSTKLTVSPTLQASSVSIAGARPRRRFTRGLVILQVALTMWVLLDAGMLVRTLRNLRTLDVGLDRAHVMTVAPVLDLNGPTDIPVLRRSLAERLRAIPGVAVVGLSSGNGLFLNSMTTAPVRVPGSSVDPARDRDVRQEWISPEYFSAVGMTVVRGRSFRDGDSTSAPRVTIINETTARYYFGQGDPIGRLMFFPKLDAQNRYTPFPQELTPEDGTEIVGVVRDAQDVSLRQPARKMAFLSLSQRNDGPPVGFGTVTSVGVIHLRLSGDPAMVSTHVRGAMKQVHPGLSVRRISMLDADIERTLGREVMMTQLVGFFGVLALLLACVGLYGVMSYTVSRRSGEIGIRIALGARHGDVAGLVLRETAGLVVGGIAIGIPAALATTRFLESLLFGLKATDALTYGAVTLVVLVVGFLAGVLPAVRASRVNPIVALRHE